MKRGKEVKPNVLSIELEVHRRQTQHGGKQKNKKQNPNAVLAL